LLHQIPEESDEKQFAIGEKSYKDVSTAKMLNCRARSFIKTLYYSPR
jgi:hypothetical protein